MITDYDLIFTPLSASYPSIAMIPAVLALGKLFYLSLAIVDLYEVLDSWHMRLVNTV